MTYLNLMNNILRRLREETVSAVSEPTNSTMVSDYINDAKQIVEETTDWSALRATISISTTASDNTYSLTGGGDSVKIMSVINDTQNCFMDYQTKDWFNNALYIAEAVEGAPKYYTFNGLDTNGDTQVLVGPTPDGVYNLRFDVIKRQADLSDNTDVLLVPSKPVINMALALLARERGETGGTSVSEFFEIANKTLADAVALDAAKHPEEMVFQTV
jgi:hypothetical protein